MRYSFSAVAFVASLALVSAQSFGDIPTCALTCFAAAVPASGCSLTDTNCQCTTGKTSITNSISNCVPGKCSADDIAKIAPAVASLCQKAGVSLSNLPTAVTSGTAATGTGSRNSSATPKASGSKTSSGAAQQTSNSAAVHGVGLGAAAIGMAALIGL